MGVQFRNCGAEEVENPRKGIFTMRQKSCSCSISVKTPGMDTHRGLQSVSKRLGDKAHKNFYICLRFSDPTEDSANHTGSFLLHTVNIRVLLGFSESSAYCS